jgi:hypothetical protein
MRRPTFEVSIDQIQAMNVSTAARAPLTPSEAMRRPTVEVSVDQTQGNNSSAAARAPLTPSAATRAPLTPSAAMRRPTFEVSIDQIQVMNASAKEKAPVTPSEAMRRQAVDVPVDQTQVNNSSATRRAPLTPSELSNLSSGSGELLNNLNRENHNSSSKDNYNYVNADSIAQSSSSSPSMNNKKSSVVEDHEQVDQAFWTADKEDLTVTSSASKFHKSLDHDRAVGRSDRSEPHINVNENFPVDSRSKGNKPLSVVEYLETLRKNGTTREAYWTADDDESVFSSTSKPIHAISGEKTDGDNSEVAEDDDDEFEEDDVGSIDNSTLGGEYSVTYWGVDDISLDGNLNLKPRPTPPASAYTDVSKGSESGLSLDLGLNEFTSALSRPFRDTSNWFTTQKWS